MIMVFELSWNYSLMPPLMLACVLSTLAAGRLHPDSIYTEPLRRKGLEVKGESGEAGAAFQKTVGDLMREPVQPVAVTATLPQIAERFLTSSNNFLPVVDDGKRLVGQVALQDLKEHLTAGQELNSVIAFDIMQPPPACLIPSQGLMEALPILLASEQRHVPVVNTLTQYRLVGAIVRAEALGILSEAIARRSTAPNT
jgi:CIC family chloride channel protein